MYVCILDCFNVFCLETNLLVDNTVHNPVVLLLYVAQDTEACARSHSQAIAAQRIDCNEDVLGREGEGG